MGIGSNTGVVEEGASLSSAGGEITIDPPVKPSSPEVMNAEGFTFLGSVPFHKEQLCRVDIMHSCNEYKSRERYMPPSNITQHAILIKSALECVVYT